MERFEYLEPTSLEEACLLLGNYGEEAKVIAGGQSLLPLIRLKLAGPQYLISLAKVPKLRTLSYSDLDGLSIGAMVTHRELESSTTTRGGLGVLAQSAASVGSPAIRNFGTIGGNLCHNECGADHPAALLALGATVKVAGANGERTIPLEELFVDYFQTALRPDEILTEIIVPPLPPRTAASYLKLRRRAVDPAIVGAAVCLTLDDGGILCKEARIGLSGVANTPLRALRAEQVLKGKVLDDSLLREAAEVAAEETSPITDAFASQNYRREMTKVFVKRSARQALDRASAC